MKILFCGTYMSPEYVKNFNCASEAANNFQNNLLLELKQTNEIQVLSYLGFPKEGKWHSAIEKSMQIQGIHYVARHGMVSRFTGLIKYYCKLLQLLPKTDWVLLYNYYYINFLIIPIAKIFGKKTALILADHSEASDYSSWLRKSIAAKVERDFQRFDKLIILSQSLYQKIQHPAKLYFPGALSLSAYQDFSLKPAMEIRVLYSGLLNEVTGIDIYLEAIRMVKNPNVRFMFTGRGALKSMIDKAAQQDNRIVYLGFLSRDEYYHLLNSVDIVINPRNMSLNENKNNFPSKIMEYLASGRRILSTRFPGYQDFEQCIRFCDSTPQAIAAELQRVLEYNDERDNVFLINRKFATQFDWSVQARRIVDFLRS